MLLDITETTMPLWASIPFVLMLLMIAVCPLIHKMEHWWEKNLNKLLVSLILGTPVAIFLIINGMTHGLEHQLLFDYIPFIILLGSLFVITGGIHLKGDIEAKPKVNTLFLGLGAILASIMGTTGAAMLLIRPVIRTNAERKYKVHTILFFIACVANCGGLLTPLGDPPLFLLYLRGADFTWFLHLVPEWAFTNIVLLLIYFILDTHYYKKENPADIMLDKTLKQPIRLEGKLNFLWLAGVVASVAFINAGTIPAMGEEDAPLWIKFLREIVLVVLIILSLLTTKKQVRTDNASGLTPDTVAAIGGNIVADIPEILLKAISVGAVFFGAMTYIGNGPNFMVKSIAEENGIKMPSFFGYMIKFSLIILLPVYVLTQVIFLWLLA